MRVSGKMKCRSYYSSIHAYAYDLGVLAEGEEELQRRMMEWEEALQRKGLKVSARKAEQLHRRRSETPNGSCMGKVARHATRGCSFCSKRQYTRLPSDLSQCLE